MKRASAIALTLSLLITLCFQKNVLALEGDTLWTMTYGENGYEEAYSIIETSDGSYLLAGWTSSYSIGYWDMYLVKTDQQGLQIWTDHYGGNLSDVARPVIETSTGEYLLAGNTNSTGTGTGDMFLVKTNCMGDSLWAHHYGGENTDGTRSLLETSEGGFLLAGGTYSYGAGGCDMILLKTNSQGDSMWAHTYGGEYDENCLCAISTSDGGFLLAGWTTSFSNGLSDMYMVKTDSQGNQLWDRNYGGIVADVAWSAVEATDGGYLLLGHTNSFGAGESDMFLLKTNNQGDSLWARTYGGDSSDWGMSIAEASESGYILAGGTNSFGVDSYNMFLVKVNSQGDSLWAKTYGGGGDEYANDCIMTTNGEYLLAGGTESFGVGGDVYLVCVRGDTLTPVSAQTATQIRQFDLYPPSPNPFNPSTVISYELRVPSHVSLQVYDTAGSLVATLVNDWQEAGAHHMTFDASDLPSGMYLIRLQAGEQVAVRKAVLLK